VSVQNRQHFCGCELFAFRRFGDCKKPVFHN
jgi:hypothetical protein